MLSDESINCWRINYGLDQRTPAAAMCWWSERANGMAPAGAVAALGLCLQEIERLRAQAQADAMQLVTTGGQAEEHWAEVQRLRKVLQAFAGVEDFAGWHDKYQPAIALARAALSNHQSTSKGPAHG